MIDTALHVASQRIPGGSTAPVVEPWTGQVMAEVVLADAARAEEATRASVHAFEATRAMSSFARKALLRKITHGLEARAAEIANLLAREAGKPIAQARAEVARAVATFDLASEEATRITGEVIPLDVTGPSEHYRGQWVRVPAGPVLAISPFNFPLNLVAHKVAPALACGASVLLKPPPQTPLASLVLAEIVREAGAPKDALQVVPCDNAVAEGLVKDDRFATLSFTGSAKVGWHLKSIAGKKRVLLELGGNAAVLVHEDGVTDYALDRIVSGAFAYAGQVCIKVQRCYLHAPIAARATEAILTRARALAPADPLDEKTVLGPMIDEANAKRVEAWIEEARAAGAEVLLAGARDGARLGPTILRMPGDGRGLKVVDEEIFGPVLTLHTYQTWEGGLALADDSKYGLQAGIFTDSHTRIRQAFARLHVGGLVVGDVPTFRVDVMPYGGSRDSGLGREGVRFAIEEMTERKLLVVREG